MRNQGSQGFNSWVRRGLAVLQGTRKNLVIGGSPLLGAHHLLNVFSQENEKTIDLELAPLFTMHEEFLASEFAHAVNERLGWRALPAAVKLEYQVRLLAKRLPDLSDYTVIIRNADFGRLLIEALQALRHPPRLILECHTPGLVTVKRSLHVDPTSLLLTADEAREIATGWGGLAVTAWPRVLSLSGGQYQLFLDNLPWPEAYDPDYWEMPMPEQTVEPRLLFEALLMRGRLTSALDAAANHPEWIAEVVNSIGPRFAEEGILGYLKLHLDSLPEPYSSDEGVLEWRLIGAMQGDTPDQMDIIARVGRYLEHNEAPSLRARYGSVIGGEPGLAEARRALRSLVTPTILYQVARLTPDPAEAERLLLEGIGRAGAAEDHHEYVRCAQLLAKRLADQGAFVEAATWAGRALALIDEHGMMNGSRRLELVYDLAVYRWMTGKSVGLHEMVRTEAESLSGVGRERFCLLLAAMAAAHDDVEVVDEKLRALASAGDVNPAVSVMHRVQFCIFQGDVKRARALAAEALTAAGGNQELRARALVASAAANVDADRERALAYLLEAEELLEPGFSPLRMNFELYLARARGGVVREEYRHLFKQVPYSSLRLLGGSGPEFHRIYTDLKQAGGVSVFISAFDKGELVINGVPQHITKQAIETLVVLALNPQGLTPDELRACLSPNVTVNNAKVAVSRVRKLVGVTRGPYQLESEYRLDLDVVWEHLRAGRVLRALEIARGQVLPWSDAVAVVRAREELEEALRAAVLASNDNEVMAAAVESMPYDAVVQAHARKRLKGHDARKHMLAPTGRPEPEELGLESA